MKDILSHQTDLNRPRRSMVSNRINWLILGPIFGPTYIALAIGDRIRRSRNQPLKVMSLGDWLECWGRGLKFGLVIGGVLSIPFAMYLMPLFGVDAALYIVQWISVLGLSVGGAIGVFCGGHDALGETVSVVPNNCSR